MLDLAMAVHISSPKSDTKKSFTVATTVYLKNSMKKKYRNLKILSDFAKNYKTSDSFKSKEKEKGKNNLLTSEEGILIVTTNSCIRPDIYLDNDRHCNGCKYYEHCGCSLKKLIGERKKRQ
jgi:hypothetical protein